MFFIKLRGVNVDSEYRFNVHAIKCIQTMQSGKTYVCYGVADAWLQVVETAEQIEELVRECLDGEISAFTRMTGTPEGGEGGPPTHS